MKSKWFKAKRYGWGWYPYSWQAWLILLIWLILFIFLLRKFVQTMNWAYYALVFVSVIILILISWKTGEKPRWRWG